MKNNFCIKTKQIIGGDIIKTYTFIHTADLHLNLMDRNYSIINIENKRDKSIFIFDSIIEKCFSDAIDILLISGDLFDNNNFDENLYNEVISKFESIPDTQIYIAPGNHDKTEDIYFYNYSLLPPNVHVFNESGILKYEFNDDIIVYGVNNKGSLKYCKECLIDENKFNIFIMHNPMNEDNYVKNYETLIESSIEENRFNYYAFGHIHDFNGFSFINNNVAAHPGSPYHIEDSNHNRGYIYGTIDGDWVDVVFKITERRN